MIEWFTDPAICKGLNTYWFTHPAICKGINKHWFTAPWAGTTLPRLHHCNSFLFPTQRQGYRETQRERERERQRERERERERER